MQEISLAIMNRPGKARSFYLLYLLGHWNSTYNTYNTYNRIYQSRNLSSSLHMAILSMEEGNPLPEKKTQAAWKRKAARKNLASLDSSGEQEFAGPSSAQDLGSSKRTIPNIAGDKEAVAPTASDNSTGVQEQVQDVEPGNGASPKPTGEAEATIPIASDIDLELQKQAKIPTDSKIDPELQKQATIPLASKIDPELQKQATIPIASVIDPKSQKQAQAAEATPEFSGEAETTIPIESLSLVTPKSTDGQSAEHSSDFATAAGSISSPDAQRNDALPCDSHSPTTSGQTGEHYVSQQDQEGQNADNLSSENMRPNAQNLRYGGYPAQPAPQHRNTPLGSGRLQNTPKIGGFEILHLVSYNRKADASGLVR